MDYNKTINLPQTSFPMRAGLPKREPEMLARWKEQDVYNELLKKNEGKPLFNLHDGPPFSNGALHMGHALNKSIKTYHPFLRHAGLLHPLYPRLGQPRHAHRVRHHQAEQAQHKAMSIPDFRSACHDFARHYMDVQSEASSAWASWATGSTPMLP